MKSRDKKFIFILMLLVFVGGNTKSLFSQNGIQMSVSGYVRDAKSNMPIPGVEVIIFNLEQESLIKVHKGTSAANGFYKIRFLNVGKYQFSITYPGIGIIHIDSIAQGSEVDNSYSFEISEGVNKTLNIFLGENNFPYIKADTSANSSEINFTMLYMNRQKESRSKLSSAPVISKECEGLTWIFKTEETEVPDDYVLGYPPPADGSIDFGKFYMQYNFFPFEYSCKDEKCDFKDLRLEVDSCILIHSVNFYKEKYGIGEDRAECFRECTLDHENFHADSYFSIACEEWINFLNKLNSTPCCDSKECKNKFYEYLSEFKMNIKSGLDKQHDDVLDDQDKECESKCPNN